MISKSTLPRVLLRRAALLLVPLLCLVAWALYCLMQQQRAIERESLEQHLLVRSTYVQGQIEQTLSLAIVTASILRHAGADADGYCAEFLSDLLGVQPQITGAAILDARRRTSCSAGKVPVSPLVLGPQLPWRLQQLADGGLQLDHRLVDAHGAALGQLSLRMDAAAVGGLGIPGEQADTVLRWLEADGAAPALPSPGAQIVSLRGRPVAELRLAEVRSVLPASVDLRVVVVALLGCVLFTLMCFLWFARRLLRSESARLIRVARHPEEGERIGRGMVAGELADAAQVIAAEQLSARELSDALLQAKENLEEIQRAASIGSWRTDLTSDRSQWSEQTRAIFGLPHDEIPRRDKLLSMVHPEDRAMVQASRSALEAGTGEMDVVHRIERAGGEERVVHARGKVAKRDDQGRPISLVGTIQDVTEAWEATSLTDALARALALSGAPVLLTREHAGVWLWAWSNRAWDRMCEQLHLGGREADYQLFNPHTGLLRNTAERVREARAQQKVLRLELELTLASPAGKRWYEAELIPQHSAPGRAGYGLLVLRDRSAERQVADALRESNTQLERLVRERTHEISRREQQYRVLADLSPQILWQADRLGNISYFNRIWYELVGAREGGWLGARWLDAVHPDDVAASLEAVGHGTRSGQPWQVRRRIKDKNGVYRSFLGVAAPVLGDQGEIELWVGVDTDITELEHHASRLQQLNAELETFSYTVSHDLRAPVHVIKGFVEALLEGQVGQVDEEARSYLERVRRSARRMEELIADLLALARLSSETLRVQRFDPGEMAQSLIQGIQERYPDQVIECHTSGGGLEIEADHRLFQVVLENLMDNAAKFSAGRPVSRIELSWRRDREQIVVEVADNGVGFPEEFAHRLFRPYQRLHAKADFAGNGIGLATVARIVQLHGGTISAHNRELGGAVFRILLPLMVRAVATGVLMLEGT